MDLKLNLAKSAKQNIIRTKFEESFLPLCIKCVINYYKICLFFGLSLFVASNLSFLFRRSYVIVIQFFLVVCTGPVSFCPSPKLRTKNVEVQNKDFM
jgi:hypothetical protein